MKKYAEQTIKISALLNNILLLMEKQDFTPADDDLQKGCAHEFHLRQPLRGYRGGGGLGGSQSEDKTLKSLNSSKKSK